MHCDSPPSTRRHPPDEELLAAAAARPSVLATSVKMFVGQLGGWRGEHHTAHPVPCVSAESLVGLQEMACAQNVTTACMFACPCPCTPHVCACTMHGVCMPAGEALMAYESAPKDPLSSAIEAASIAARWVRMRVWVQGGSRARAQSGCREGVHAVAVFRGPHVHDVLNDPHLC